MTTAEKESVDYQVRTKILDYTLEIVDSRSYTKTRTQQYTALKLLIYIHALDFKRFLTTEKIDTIYNGLIAIANINDYPVAPLVSTPPSQVIKTDKTTLDYDAYSVKDAIGNGDFFSFWDSVVGVIKKTTWSNLKSLFQTMIDDERARKFNVSTNPPSGTPVEGEEWVVYTA